MQQSKEWSKLYEKYSKGKISVNEVSELMGCSTRTVYRKFAELRDEVPQVKPKAKSAKKEKPVGYKYDIVANDFSVTVTKTKDGKLIGTSSVTKDSKEKFNTVWDMIESGGIGQKNLAAVSEFLSEAETINNVTNGLVKIDVENVQVTVTDSKGRNTVAPAGLTKRIIESFRKGDRNLDKFSRFAERLVNNPSRESVESLFDFLEHASIEITEDGMVECYKVITKDYLDCYTCTIPNRIGTWVEMPRDKVNPDRNETCSYGLHVCSRSYVNVMTSSNTILVKVLVDPADFVAVPYDYNKAKARVCRYFVKELVDNDSK